MYKPQQGNVSTNECYFEWPASERFEKIVACFWKLEMHENTSYLAIPDACVDVVIELNHSNRVHLIGSHTKYRKFSLTKSTSYLGVRFMPGAINSLINIDLSSSKNKIIHLDSLNKSSLNELASSIATLDDMHLYQSQIEKWIQNNYTSKKHNERVMCAINEIIKHEGMVSLDNSLSYPTGFSLRQLRKMVQKLTGLNLKELSRIIRFQSALKMMTGNRKKQSDICTNFFDQSHMIREFKCFTGHSPKKFINMSILSN